MKSHIKLTILILLLLSVSGFAQTLDDFPVKLERVSKDVIVARTGEYYVTNMTAIATSKGIVVVDTNIIPSMAIKIRKMFEKEFGRNDFVYVINTHSHWDHTDGNFAYPEATIIGHDNVDPIMREFEANQSDFIVSQKEWLTNFEQQVEEMGPNHEHYGRNQDIILFNKILMPELEKGLQIVPPNLTFNDRMTVSLGDKTLKLQYFEGNTHTNSDIMIYVPEEKLLFTGDLFTQGMVPFLSGAEDMPKYLEGMSSLFDDGMEISLDIPGHQQFISGDELREKYDYAKDLWEGLKEAYEKGLTMDEALEEFSFDKKFSRYGKQTHSWEGRDYHLTNVIKIWKMLQK